MVTVCSMPGDTIRHVSGLRVMVRAYPNVPTVSAHEVLLPVNCCPRSGNPLGGMLRIQYAPARTVLEVYSLKALLMRFVGGFPGVGPYPAERNMEGMIQLVAQMAADALEVPVRARAIALLDTGAMRVICRAIPQVTIEEKPTDV